MGITFVIIDKKLKFVYNNKRYFFYFVPKFTV